MGINELSQAHFSPCTKVSDSHMALTDIFAPDTSVALWQRPAQSAIEQYFTDHFSSLRINLRGVYALTSLKQELTDTLPCHIYKDAVVDDIYLLSEMLTCLFDCDSVGLRLTPLQKAMCPKFHVDNIPVRLVSTYIGPGTEWLAANATDDAHIMQMTAFDVGLLKGQAWEGQAHMAAKHRSCQVSANDQRVLLTLDPM